VEVESVVADTPSDCAFLRGRLYLISLTVNAKVHNVVPADGTVLDDDIPCPQRNRVPLLDLKPLLVAFGSRLLRLLARRCVHFHIRHCNESI